MYLLYCYCNQILYFSPLTSILHNVQSLRFQINFWMVNFVKRVSLHLLLFPFYYCIPLIHFYQLQKWINKCCQVLKVNLLHQALHLMSQWGSNQVNLWMLARTEPEQQPTLDNQQTFDMWALALPYPWSWSLFSNRC